MMEFYGYWRSSAAYRCRIALGLKGLDYDFHRIHLRNGQQRLPEYLVHNPQGLLPTLIADGQTLTQSLAIIEWLEETHPEPALLPADPRDRARVRAFAQAIACDIHPLQNLRVLQHLKNQHGFDQDKLDGWCRKWNADGLTACEALLADQPPDQRYCFGGAPGLADICLMPQLYSARRFGVDLSPMPRLLQLESEYEAHPVFVAAHPDVQPDKDL